MDERVGLFAIEVGYEANTARIVLICRVVEALLARKSEIFHQATDFGLAGVRESERGSTAGNPPPEFLALVGG